MHDFDAEGCADLVGRQREQALPRNRQVEIQDRHDIAGAHPAERARRSANANVDERRWFAAQLQTRRKLLELKRNTEAALDGLLAGNRHPQQNGERHGEQLEPEMAEGRDHVYCTSRFPARARRWMIRARSRLRRAS